MAPETDHEIVSELIGVDRRSLLKALSAGAGLAVGGAGIAAGSASGEDDAGDDAAGADDDRDGSDDGQQESRTIDPHYGFASPEGEEPPAEIQPDHTVDLLVRFPEPPEGGPEGENEEGSGDGDESDENESESGNGDAGGERPQFDHPPFFVFEPVGLHVSTGDVVQFTFTTPDHTVTAYHAGNGMPQRVPEGVPPFSSPVVKVGGYWLYQFDEPGVYDVYCGPHHFFGMVMRIVVGDVGEGELPDYATSPQPEHGPPSSEDIAGLLNAFRDGTCEWPLVAPAEVFGSSALDPMAIQESGSVPFDAVATDLGYDLEGGDGMGEGDDGDGDDADDGD